MDGMFCFPWEFGFYPPLFWDISTGGRKRETFLLKPSSKRNTLIFYVLFMLAFKVLVCQWLYLISVEGYNWNFLCFFLWYNRSFCFGSVVARFAGGESVFLWAGSFHMLRLCLKGFGELIQFVICGFRSASTAKNPIYVEKDETKVYLCSFKGWLAELMTAVKTIALVSAKLQQFTWDLTKKFTTQMKKEGIRGTAKHRVCCPSWMLRVSVKIGAGNEGSISERVGHLADFLAFLLQGWKNQSLSLFQVKWSQELC